ncbi:MAG: ATP-binding protein [Nitrospira sp.]|nr:ATP-binding protein [Nitrospira sp.]
MTRLVKISTEIEVETVLIEFRVANYRSIKEEQTLSLVSSRSKELMDSHTFEAKGFKDRLLRSAAVYGPNASGKTNLFLALGTMREIVEESAREGHSGDLLPVEPFKLDSRSHKEPTQFEVVFMVQGVRYQYGFSATATSVVSEWLFAFPEGRPRCWFERELGKNGHCKWNLGASLKGEKQLWQKSTRDNALFLSTAEQLNSQQLKPVFDWFKDTLRFVGARGVSPWFSASFCEKHGPDKVVDFLQEADLGIHNVYVKQEPVDPENLSEDRPDSGEKRIVRFMVDKEVRKIKFRFRMDKETPEIKTVHISSTGDLVEFDLLVQESSGTRKVFGLAGPFLESLQNGHVVCIDELHNSLHPELVKFLVGLFNDNTTNHRNAQLIFTTHETSMLNQKILRRDQIWFCEKDKNQATTVYPLTDFHPRKGVENLELAYLSGRYGALPYPNATRSRRRKAYLSGRYGALPCIPASH